MTYLYQASIAHGIYQYLVSLDSELQNQSVEAVLNDNWNSIKKTLTPDQRNDIETLLRTIRDTTHTHEEIHIRIQSYLSNVILFVSERNVLRTFVQNEINKITNCTKEMLAASK